MFMGFPSVSTPLPCTDGVSVSWPCLSDKGLSGNGAKALHAHGGGRITPLLVGKVLDWSFRPE